MGVQRTTSQRPWVARAASVVLVGLGVFLLKICVFDVLAAARRHETVSLSVRGVILAPLFVIMGLLALAASLSSNSKAWTERFSNPETKRLNPLGWAAAVALLAVGGGVYFWLKSRLAALGYDL